MCVCVCLWTVIYSIRVLTSVRSLYAYSETHSYVFRASKVASFDAFCRDVGRKFRHIHPKPRHDFAVAWRNQEAGDKAIPYSKECPHCCRCNTKLKNTSEPKLKLTSATPMQEWYVVYAAPTWTDTHCQLCEKSTKFCTRHGRAGCRRFRPEAS